MQKPSFFKSSSHAMVSGAAQQGFALVHFLMAVRWLTPTEVGVWAMFLTLTSFIEIGRLGLIQNAMVHFTTHNPDERPKIATAALVLSIGSSIVGALILWILSFLLRGVFQMPDLPVLMFGYIILTVLNAALRFFDGWLMTEHNFKISMLTAIIFGATYCLSTAFVKIFFGILSPEILVLLQIPASLIALAVILKMNLRNIKFAKIDRLWLKQLYQFGRYGLGTNLSSMIFQRVDVLLLGAFMPPAALAIYNVASRIISYLDFPLNMLGLVLLPKIAAENRAAGTEGVIQLYEKSVAGLLAFTVPVTILTVIGAKYLVIVMAGSAFLEATFLVQILALSGLVKPWGRLFGVTLDAVGKPEWNLKMLIFSMFVTVVFNLLLIPRFGTEGAAMATTLAIFFTIGLGQILLRRWMHVGFRRTLFGVVPAYRFIFSKMKGI